MKSVICRNVVLKSMMCRNAVMFVFVLVCFCFFGGVLARSASLFKVLRLCSTAWRLVLKEAAVI